MSCFRGLMNEYTSISIDRFDGRNLLCTAYFLSHCHKDHMVGLSNPAFLECLQSRDDVFLYCSEITRLLLLADEEYKQLDDYIHVLEVGTAHPVLIPGNTVYRESYNVSVTLIPAGHCPGSVMFLFEGAEGTCLYTGDFRWEMNQASKMAAFKDANGVKNIRSLYVDTTFCVPGAYHIPTRNECVEAAITLVSDWLRHSPLHIVYVSCPARYGHEHFLMELAIRLDTKIHIPTWKIEIYEQISELCGVFTSNPKEARIHACSMKVRQVTCLSRRREKFHILSIRPSTMWFTSEKTKAKPEDLIATPASVRGMHRVCYSMHSSYSEIRDLVSYLQPEKALPNVLPASDESMDAVQARLNSFLSFPHKLRLKPAIPDTAAQPLGTLKKLRPAQISIQPQPGAANSDELVFSSQDSSPSKTSLCDSGISKLCTVNQPASTHTFPGKTDNGDSAQLFPKEDVAPDAPSGCSSLNSHSSYSGSQEKNGERNLFSDEDEVDDNEKMGDKLAGMVKTNEQESQSEEEEESFRLYISGSSEVSDDEDESECDMVNTRTKVVAGNDAYMLKSAESKNALLLANNDSSINILQDRIQFSTEIKHDNTSQEDQEQQPALKLTDLKLDRDKEQMRQCDKAVKSKIQESENSLDLVNESKAYVKSGISLLCSQADVTVRSTELDQNDNDNDDGSDCDDEDDIIPSSQGTPVKLFKLSQRGRHIETTLNQRPHAKEQVSTTEEEIPVLSLSDDSESTQSYESQIFWCTNQKQKNPQSIADNDDSSARESTTSVNKMGQHSYVGIQNKFIDKGSGKTHKISQQAISSKNSNSQLGALSPSSATSDLEIEILDDCVQSKQLSLKRKYKTDAELFCISAKTVHSFDISSSKQFSTSQNIQDGLSDVKKKSDRMTEAKTDRNSGFTVTNADDSQTKRMKMLRESDLVDLTGDEEDAVIDLTLDSSSPL